MEAETKIKALKKFFDIDMKIKDMLIRMAPTEMDDLSTENRMEYIDKLYAELTNIETSISMALEGLNIEYSIQNVVKDFFEKKKQQFLIRGYENLDLKAFYKDNFSDMNPVLIEKVKETCVGYTWDNSSLDIGNLISDSKSINEILHVIHSYIVNDEGVLKSMPVLATKQNKSKYPITLYGEENEMARKLYENFPLDLDCGWTEIVGMQNKILMMIRDRGHALTIDIDTSKEEEIMVRYFVPKLCNLGMIRRLPGINKISPNGATGIFRINAQTMPSEITDFIGQVPMDSDIKPYRKEDINNVLIDVETNNLVRENLEAPPCFEMSEVKELTETRAKTQIASIKDLLSKSIDKLLGRNNSRGIGEER